jgi:phospholipid/cholesterol/gamma-HCH transport system substrate-binding protein
METRAPYALVGLLVIAAIGSVFGFIYWLNNAGALGYRTVYDIRFENTVSGLLKGAGVLFNGIRVGEVIDLRLSPDDPRRITAKVSVAADTPIRADTHVDLEFQGLTGVPVIALEGRSKMAPPTPSAGLPVLTADPSASLSMTQSARNTLLQLQGLLSENSEPLHSTLANLNTFSAALARNSDRLDGIVAGLERLTGSGVVPKPIFYDLTAPRDFPTLKKTPSAQFSIPEPTAVLMFDTQKIVVRPSGTEGPTFSDAKWSDNIPKLVQTRIIQSFENANMLRSVSKPIEGSPTGRQLLIDIRNFQLSVAAAPQAEIELSAKILGDNGKIIDAKIFRVSVPATSTDAPSAAAALDSAFEKVATELVVWASELL